jgi:hypothetical protein
MANRGALVLGALWVAGAVAATSVGLVAVHLVGNEVGGQVAAPLDDESVQRALSSVSVPPSASEMPEREPSHATEDGEAATVTTAGGVVSARCRNGAPRLLYATPADGYRSEPGATTVRFVDRTRVVTLTMACTATRLTTTTRTDSVSTAPSPAPVRTVAPEPQRTQEPVPSEQPEPGSRSEPTDRSVQDAAEH